MGRYKLIALDMDGTVLNEHEAISEENRKWIEAAMEAGVTVMFATGRGMHSVKAFVEELGWSSPIVTANGGEVWMAPGRLKSRYPLDTELVKRMHRIARENDTWYWGYNIDGVFNRDTWPETEDGFSWLKFGYHTDDTEKLARIRAELESWGTLELTNSHIHNIEINPRGVSKATGMTEVCRELGFGLDDVVAMGDSLNDIALIRAAGLGIAMGNAQEAVKAAAKAVTGTNVEHGVAQAIRKYVLEL